MTPFSLNILIVEDDISLALDVEMMIDEMGYNLVGRVDNSTEALEIIYTYQPDLILMDIDIKGSLTGIEVAHKIKPLDIPVLFITSFDDEEHFSRAIVTNYIGYLVKPVNKFTLRATIETAFKRLSEEAQEETQQSAFPFKDSLFFKKRGILHKIPIKSILYISADGDYTITVTEVGEFISSLRLFEIEKVLKNYSFIKIHRSHIVNLEKVNSIDPTNNVLRIGAREIPISRANRNLLLEKIHFLK